MLDDETLSQFSAAYLGLYAFEKTAAQGRHIVEVFLRSTNYFLDSEVKAGKKAIQFVTLHDRANPCGNPFADFS